MRPTLILACLVCLSTPALAQSSAMTGLTDHTGMGAALESMRTRQAEYNQDQEEQRQKHRAILAEQQDQMLAERKARLQQTMGASMVQTSRAAQMMESPAAPVAAPQMQPQPMMMAPQVAAPNQPQMRYLDQDARAKELMAQSRAAAAAAPTASLDDEEPVAAAPAPVVQPPVAAARPAMTAAAPKFVPVAADDDDDDDTDAKTTAKTVTPPPVKQSAAKQSASASAYKYKLPSIRGVQSGR